MYNIIKFFLVNLAALALSIPLGLICLMILMVVVTNLFSNYLCLGENFSFPSIISKTCINLDRFLPIVMVVFIISWFVLFRRLIGHSIK